MKTKKILITMAVAASLFCPASHAYTNILITKGASKDGSFKTNGYTDHIPAGVKNYDYTDKWKEAVAKDHGDILESK